ncbi:TonB-dependent receptor [Hydrogenophaga soli]
MRHTQKFKKKSAPALSKKAQAATEKIAINTTLLPLGALLLAGSVTAMAQTAPADKTLSTVVVKEAAEAPEGKDSVRATEVTIGKGKQLLRDVPQSVTVVTEKVMDDRNLDTLKEVLATTGGISFQAAEGGEEDIKLRGFSLQGSGDVFVDGMRDPAFYERDTFNFDRVEVMRGSASMLFGRGSTGGAVNMVNKAARLIDEHQVDVTVGSHNLKRVVGDFNLKTGDSAALRLNAMVNTADNDGAGNRIDKHGIAGTYRWGIGERDEFSASFFSLENRNGINYGLPWIRPTATAAASTATYLPLDPKTYRGMDSDRNHGSANTVGFTHTHRFDRENELVTKVRKGQYERDMRASTIRFAAASAQPGGKAAGLDTFGPSTVLNRGNQLKVQNLDTLYIQSDYSGKFNAGGLRHEVLAGVDFAQEDKVVYGARTAAQGGVVPTKATTTVGGVTSSNWVDEGSRVLRQTSRYKSKGYGVYAQDMVQLSPTWKLLAGLRFDSLTGDYDSFAIPTTAAGPVTTTHYRMKVSEWSKRIGALYQPSELTTWYASAATSFNTSGDAYSLSSANVNVPPEQSINMEVGVKLESANKQWTTRFAAFRSTKLHERNTDPDSSLVTLSGKRHVAGLEAEVAGRITPQWEVFANYVWMPVAKIDIGVAGSEGQGTRPSLTPYHSGSVWTTYALTPLWRVGAGVNFRGRQTPNRNPGWEVPGWATIDLMAEYAWIPDKLTLKANLTNATNKLYGDQLYTGHYIPGAGRTLQVTANIKF